MSSLFIYFFKQVRSEISKHCVVVVVVVPNHQQWSVRPQNTVYDTLFICLNLRKIRFVRVSLGCSSLS